VAIDIIPLLYPNQQQFYPEVAPEAVTGLDDYVNNLIAASVSGSGSFYGITMDAILTVVQQHLSVALDVKTGHLQLNATDVTEQDIVDQIAAKVIASIKLNVTNGDLTIEGSD
jgi:hypothetical protein